MKQDPSTITAISLAGRAGSVELGTSRHDHHDRLTVASFEAGRFPVGDAGGEWGIWTTWSDGSRDFHPGRTVTRISFAATERRR